MGTPSGLVEFRADDSGHDEGEPLQVTALGHGSPTSRGSLAEPGRSHAGMSTDYPDSKSSLHQLFPLNGNIVLADW